MTSARFYHLSEMVLEAADYLADHDHFATEQLNEAGALLAEIGGREATRERGGREQPALPGIVGRSTGAESTRALRIVSNLPIAVMGSYRHTR